MDVNEELKFYENSKKKKKIGGGGEEGESGESGWGRVRVDVIEDLKFLGKFTKKN